MYAHPEDHAADVACESILRGACPDAHVELVFGHILIKRQGREVASVFSLGRGWYVDTRHTGISHPAAGIHPTPAAAADAVRAILRDA